MRPCTFSVENRSGNTQGGAQMTSPPAAAIMPGTAAGSGLSEASCIGGVRGGMSTHYAARAFCFEFRATCRMIFKSCLLLVRLLE
jgi:hypothetical protein